ncbi:MAG: hypothetical protein ACYS8X_11410 [Planctomycetota bacterium]
MTSRELVKAAIRHEQTDRCPYYFEMCGDAIEQLEPVMGGKSFAEFVDNDVIMLGPPWWQWHELGSDWSGMDLPTSPEKTRGYGSYEEFFDRLKELADATDKYLLVGIYGSHRSRSSRNSSTGSSSPKASERPRRVHLAREEIDKQWG